MKEVLFRRKLFVGDIELGRLHSQKSPTIHSGSAVTQRYSREGNTNTAYTQRALRAPPSGRSSNRNARVWRNEDSLVHSVVLLNSIVHYLFICYSPVR